ncbi:hypothetical protein HPB49_021419 [Dermacentor silvarum]|uniref:Uncharacterized protein n=1 Tax=Dermacentor silvarum TaxID=543639 RepID=A0ACB8CBF3_DERSI|nr:hypothetical protein HPB49_021419 [Dermacentor silvarum]
MHSIASAEQQLRKLSLARDASRPSLFFFFFSFFCMVAPGIDAKRALFRSKPCGGVLHGDLNENNVLTRPKGDGIENDEEVYAVLDWGDVHGGPRVLDLAVLLAYVFMAPGGRSPEENAGLALSGYLRHVPDEVSTMPLLRTLVAARLCQSVVKGLESFRKNPDNQYVLYTQDSGWRCLRWLWETPNEHLLGTWNRVIAEAQALVDRGATSTRT